MQSRQKVHGGGDCGDLLGSGLHELVFAPPRRREKCPVTKAKLIFWKQSDGERSGRTKRRHVMSCRKPPELQFNRASFTFAKPPDGHTKRRIKKDVCTFTYTDWQVSTVRTRTSPMLRRAPGIGAALILRVHL